MQALRQIADWSGLEFYIDGVRQDRISGTVNWQKKTYTVSGTGNHTLKWRYVKDSSVPGGSDCGWVDYVQWSGWAAPVPLPTEWDEISYTYDAAGRRIEKKYDGWVVVKYLYDGDQCIAEYDGNNNLLRKYIFGPGVDEPISMIDVEHSNATYYYHFDALGSVIALSDTDGNTAELYEYSVYGQVAASDANNPNRFMFTGREFDKETGLYYYRARYYHPEIGRFLQTDPVGYSDGMNIYRYCMNSPLSRADPSGCLSLEKYVVQSVAGWTAKTVVSKGFEQLPEAWQEAGTLYSQWVTGSGPDEVVLGRGNALVEELIGTRQIQGAMQEFRKADAGKPLEEWKAVEYRPYGKEGFGAGDAIAAGTNAALQFLGTFTVEVRPRQTADGQETIVVNNTVSWSSYWRWLKILGYPVPPSWERTTFAPCGNMKTTMMWGWNVLDPDARCNWCGAPCPPGEDCDLLCPQCDPRRAHEPS